MSEKEIKKDAEKKAKGAVELNLDDLENVSGGAGLRDVYITSTKDITESVKDRS